MANALFNELKNEAYCDLFDETLFLWGKYSKEYCSILEEYLELLEEKRRKKLPLNKIKVSSLMEFPVITFLCIDNRDDAEEYLLNLTTSKLRDVYAQITNYASSKLRADLIAKIHDYRTQLYLKTVKKSLYAMDPNACGSGRKSARRSTLKD